MKEKIASKEAGRLLGARGIVTWNRTAEYYTDSSWRGKWATEGGGALINQSIHTMDLLGEFLGKPIWVEAGIANHHLAGVIEVEDTMEAYISYENAKASFYATTAYCDDAPPLIEVVCENMRFRIEEPEVTVFYKDGSKERKELNAHKILGKSYWGSGHLACIEDFYHCIQIGKEFKNNLCGAENTIRLMLACYDAARERGRKQIWKEVF